MLLFSNAVVSLHTEAGVRSELAGAAASSASASSSADPPLPPLAELPPSEPFICHYFLIFGVGPHSV